MEARGGKRQGGQHQRVGNGEIERHPAKRAIAFRKDIDVAENLVTGKGQHGQQQLGWCGRCRRAPVGRNHVKGAAQQRVAHCRIEVAHYVGIVAFLRPGAGHGENGPIDAIKGGHEGSVVRLFSGLKKQKIDGDGGCAGIAYQGNRLGDIAS